MGNCCCRKSKASSNSPLSILMLGVENSGKTEVGHTLSSIERIDFSPTKGIRVFDINVRGQAIKLMEIGGAATVRDLWPHYYNEAHGIIYVINCAKDAPFELMRELLQSLMGHKNVRQKPLLIVANKQDLDESLDLVDITYFFHIDDLANLLGTPSFIATCGFRNQHDLFIGIEWLVDYIVTNIHALTNRIQFNRSVLSPVIGKIRRQMTSVPRKNRDGPARVRSAPSSIGADRNRRFLRNSAKVMPMPTTHFPRNRESSKQPQQPLQQQQCQQEEQEPIHHTPQNLQKNQQQQQQMNVVSILHQ